MTEPTFHLMIPEAGRADVLLAGMIDGLTRSAAQRWLEEGRVVLEGRPVKKNARLEPGQVLSVTPPQPEAVDVIPQDIPLDVVYEDGDVIVVNKPVGMVVHPAPGHPDGTLVNALLYHCENSLSGINGQLRPGIVHRIDRDTSGLVIAAKNDRAHLALAEQLQDHSLFRLYHAVVLGGFRDEAGTVDAPIARHPTDRKRMAVCRPGQGREAVTHYQIVDSHDGYTHLTCRLETGRTHQIRVHMASLGCPLTGDFLYGYEDRSLISRPALHSAQLSLRQPVTGQELSFTLPLPEDMARLLTHQKGEKEP